MTALSANLVASKDRNPNGVALRCDELRFTFAEFDVAAARVATLLERAGVQPGDRVGVMLPNTPAFAIAFYGIMYRGAVAVHDGRPWLACTAWAAVRVGLVALCPPVSFVEDA